MKNSIVQIVYTILEIIKWCRNTILDMSQLSK